MSQLSPILMVEDDEAHALIVSAVFEAARLANPVVVVNDVRSALACLEGRPVSPERGPTPLPVLILLDLDLGGVSGLELLSRAQEHPRFREIPVVVLTASDDAADIEAAFELGARSCLVKPVAFEALLDIVGVLELRWAILDDATGRAS